MNTIPSVLFDPHIGTWTMNKICNDVVVGKRQNVHCTHYRQYYKGIPSILYGSTLLQDNTPRIK